MNFLLIEFVGYVCGNKIVESLDEECDCGWDEECMEMCCNKVGILNECKYIVSILGFCRYGDYFFFGLINIDYDDV